MYFVFYGYDLERRMDAVPNWRIAGRTQKQIEPHQYTK